MLHRNVFVPLLGKFMCLVYPTAYLSGRSSVSLHIRRQLCMRTGSERRSCMTAVPSGYTSHQGNPVSRPELQPFRSFISPRRYVTSAAVTLIYVTAVVAVKIFCLFSVLFLFGCLFVIS